LQTTIRVKLNLDGQRVRKNYAKPRDIYSDSFRASIAGAKIWLPAKDQFWDDRTARIMDPQGHVWMISGRIEEISPAEREERWSKILNK